MCGRTSACKKEEGEEEGRANVCGAKNVSRIRKRREGRRGGRGGGRGGRGEGREGKGEKGGDEERRKGRERRREKGGEGKEERRRKGRGRRERGREGRRGGENKYIVFVVKRGHDEQNGRATNAYGREVEREKSRGKMFWVERVLCENDERGRG